MARVKRGVTAGRRHKKVLGKAKGYYNARRKVYRAAKQAVIKAGQYAYRDRRAKKREFRALWIMRINAAARMHGLSYSRLIAGLHKAGLEIDRKVLADLAINDANAFGVIAEQAKSQSRRGLSSACAGRGRARRLSDGCAGADPRAGTLAELEEIRVHWLGKQGPAHRAAQGARRACRRPSGRLPARASTRPKQQLQQAIEARRARARTRRQSSTQLAPGAIDVTLARARRGAGRPASDHADAAAHRGDFPPRRLRGRRRAGDRGRVPQFRSAEHSGRITRRARCTTRSICKDGICCAPTPRRCRFAPCSAASRRWR